MSDDVEGYRKRLLPIEREAGDLPWANDRPWRVATHVAWEGELPVVDLHALSAALARQAVQQVLAQPPAGGAVVFVHGKGKHTAGTPVLKGVVLKELARACSDTAAYSFRPLGPARMVWISDWSRAPSSVTGRTGCWTWLFGGLFLAAFALAVLRALGWVG